jgi:N-acetylglucosamine-6-sulfatase
MQAAGYNTYYTGKLMNSYDETNYKKPFVKGFNGSDILTGPGVYNYHNPNYQRNEEKAKRYKNQYTTDVL